MGSVIYPDNPCPSCGRFDPKEGCGSAGSVCTSGLDSKGNPIGYPSMWYPKDRNDSPQNDPVNHPAHYGGDTTYEAIKVIEAWGLDFYLGNVAKYIARAGKKTDNALEDLRKAKFYLDREINILERKPKHDT